MTAPADRSRAGRAAEDAACEFLLAHGLELRQRNYRVRGGEIDLVMGDGATIVFVEVRARTSTGFMHPAESVNARKQRRIIHAAQRYLQDTRALHTARVRFDVVCLEGDPGTGTIEWIRRAFDA